MTARIEFKCGAWSLVNINSTGEVRAVPTLKLLGSFHRCHVIKKQWMETRLHNPKTIGVPPSFFSPVTHGPFFLHSRPLLARQTHSSFSSDPKSKRAQEQRPPSTHARATSNDYLRGLAAEHAKSQRHDPKQRQCRVGTALSNTHTTSHSEAEGVETCTAPMSRRRRDMTQSGCDRRFFQAVAPGRVLRQLRRRSVISPLTSTCWSAASAFSR
jgi:hypothetical protein